MFKSIDYNALDREFWPGKPLSREIRRRMFFFVFERRGTEGNLTYSSWAIFKTRNGESENGNGERGTGNL